MGTVDVDIDNSSHLEDFMQQWQAYFFNSYFSHLIDQSPVDVNIVQLWKEQVANQSPFPNDILKKQSVTIKDLIR